MGCDEQMRSLLGSEVMAHAEERKLTRWREGCLGFVEKKAAILNAVLEEPNECFAVRRSFSDQPPHDWFGTVGLA